MRSSGAADCYLHKQNYGAPKFLLSKILPHFIGHVRSPSEVFCGDTGVSVYFFALWNPPQSAIAGTNQSHTSLTTPVFLKELSTKWVKLSLRSYGRTRRTGAALPRLSATVQHTLKPTLSVNIQSLLFPPCNTILSCRIEMSSFNLNHTSLCRSILTSHLFILIHALSLQ
jgi:hypothetical protein